MMPTLKPENRAKYQANWPDIRERIRARSGDKLIKSVRTVPHVHDHDPANCADDNLAHLCQRCDNKHNAPMRRQHAAPSRKAANAIGELF